LKIYIFFYFQQSTTALRPDRVGIWNSGSKANQNVLFCNQNLLQTQAIIKKLKHKPQRVIETSSLELITQLVASGLGLGLLPERVAKLSRSKIELLSSSPLYVDTLFLVYRPEFGRNKAERMTIDAIKSVFS
jgi:DNA-binding transcriptional LysR family regulator